jgi:hypothetical protein
VIPSLARKVVTTLTDDLDGSEAAETVSFSLDTSAYEMELSMANATELRGILAPYKAAGRKLPGARTLKQSGSTVPSKEARKWATENGIAVNPRGRVNEAVLQQYIAALG